MFEIPSNYKIEKCIITKKTVEEKAEPVLVINENREIKKTNKIKKKRNIQNEETA